MGSAASLGYSDDRALFSDLASEYEKAVQEGADAKAQLARVKARLRPKPEPEPEPEPEPAAAPAPQAAGPRRRNAPIFAKVCASGGSTPRLATEDKTERSTGLITAALKHTLFDADEDSLIQDTHVIEVMHRLHASPGTDVVVEGDPGDHFYVVDEGELDVFIDDIRVNSLGPGDYFGELALIYNAPRAATVRARSTCVLWTLDRAKFREIQARASVNSLVQRCRWLQEVPLLSSLSRRQLAVLAGALQVQEFSDGEHIITQGQAGDAFFILESGAVKVQMAASLRQAFKNLTNRLRALTAFGGQPSTAESMEGAMALIEPGSLRAPQQVAKLHEGSYFGEAALLTNQPRNASVIAVGHVKCLRLDRDRFQELLGPLGDLLEMNANIRYLRAVPDFADMDERALKDIVGQMTLVDFPEGHVIAQLGDRLDGLFLIKQGQVVVSDGSTDEYVLQSGAHFGEAALAGRGSTQTCTALTAVHCLLLPAVESAAVRRATARRQTAMRQRQTVVKSIHAQLVDVENDLSELDELAVLGEGSFGRVSLVSAGDAGVFALKKMSKAHIVEHGQEAHIANERKVLLSMTPHPFVAQLYATSQDADSLYMLCELVQGGELFSVIHSHGCRDMAAARFYCANVYLALEHLHAQDVAYRDLKPENVLVSATGFCKLIDMGFAKAIPYTEMLGGGASEVHTKSYTLCGTPEYLAPEFVLNTGHDHAVDYWALGVLTYEILFGRTPFETADRNYAEMFKNIALCRTQGNLPPFPEEFADNADYDDATRHAMDVICRLLHGNADQRLGMRGEFRKHPWFAELSWEAMTDQEAEPPFVPVISGPFDVSNFNADAGDPPDIEPYDGEYQFMGF